jgi:hypothetical protein
MRTRPTIIALLAAGALTVAACSSDSSSSDNPYAEPISASLAAEADSPLDEAQTDCLGAGFADVVGVDRFEAAGIQPEDVETSSSMDDLGLELTADDTSGFVEVLDDCDIDIKQLLLDQWATSDEVPAEFVTCVENDVDDTELRELFAQSMTGEGGDENALFELLGPCLELVGE